MACPSFEGAKSASYFSTIAATLQRGIDLDQRLAISDLIIFARRSTSPSLLLWVVLVTCRMWWSKVDANLRRGEPLWREAGDGHGSTLVVTEAGLLAIGIEPEVVNTVAAIREHAKAEPAAKLPMPREGTKQAMLVTMLRSSKGGSMEDIVAATGWIAADVHCSSQAFSACVICPVTSSAFSLAYYPPATRSRSMWDHW
jgi:hypothetical protein